MSICPITNQEVIKLTPMMKFIIRIMKIIKSKEIVTEHELNRYLNIPVTACFEFGYPNILSLLQSFQDIFIINKDELSSRDYYQIKLNPDCLCISTIQIHNIKSNKYFFLYIQ